LLEKKNSITISLLVLEKFNFKIDTKNHWLQLSMKIIDSLFLLGQENSLILTFVTMG